MHFFISTYLFLEESKTWNRKNFVIDSSAINSCYLCWFHTSLLCWYQYQVLCCAKSSQSCPSLCDPMDGSPPGSSVHGILRARILGGGCHFSSRISSPPRVGTRISPALAGGFFTTSAIWETHQYHFLH